MFVLCFFYFIYFPILFCQRTALNNANAIHVFKECACPEGAPLDNTDATVLFPSI